MYTDVVFTLYFSFNTQLKRRTENENHNYATVNEIILIKL